MSVYKGYDPALTGGVAVADTVITPSTTWSSEKINNEIQAVLEEVGNIGSGSTQSITEHNASATAHQDIRTAVTQALTDAKSYTDEAVGKVVQFSIEVASSLPTSDIKANTIYLIPNGETSGNDVQDEFLYVGGKWEKIGNTRIDMSLYVLKTDLATTLADYAKTADIQDELDKAHEHSNQTDVLDKLGVTDGKLTLDGARVGNDVDAALSATSVAPVQNKVVKAALDEKADKATTLEGYGITDAVANGDFIQLLEENNVLKYLGTAANKMTSAADDNVDFWKGQGSGWMYFTFGNSPYIGQENVGTLFSYVTGDNVYQIWHCTTATASRLTIKTRYFATTGWSGRWDDVPIGPATASKLGGIKVGAGLKAAADGTVSVNTDDTYDATSGNPISGKGVASVMEDALGTIRMPFHSDFTISDSNKIRTNMKMDFDKSLFMKAKFSVPDVTKRYALLCNYYGSTGSNTKVLNIELRQGSGGLTLDIYTPNTSRANLSTKFIEADTEYELVVTYDAETHRFCGYLNGEECLSFVADVSGLTTGDCWTIGGDDRSGSASTYGTPYSLRYIAAWQFD